MKETQENEITLDEDEPEVIKLLLQYLYEGEYEPKLPTVRKEMKKSPKIKRGSRSGYIPPHLRQQEQQKGQHHTCLKDNLNGWGTYVCGEVLCVHHRCDEDCSGDCEDFSCSACMEMEDPRPDEAQQPMTHSQMYECADKYDVAGLKDLAKEKFKLACDASWNDATFAAAATHAFTTTPDNDMGLRDVVIETLKNHLELINKPEIEVLLTEFNGLAFGILKQKMAEGWR